MFGALLSQKPSRAISQRGTSVMIECRQVDSQLTWMYWYRQLPGQSLVLMATANQGSKATYESGFTEDKFPISRPKLAFSTLTVSNASSEDSSSYFCSAADTVLGTDQGSQQEPLSLPPSSRQVSLRSLGGRLEGGNHRGSCLCAGGWGRCEWSAEDEEGTGGSAGGLHPQTGRVTTGG